MKRNFKVALVIALIGAVSIFLGGCSQSKKFEKMLEECMDEGEYQVAYLLPSEFSPDIKISKKVVKIYDDLDTYIQMLEIVGDPYRADKLNELENLQENLNGSYKDYKQFKKDVKEIEEYIDKQKEIASELEDTISKMEEAKKDGDIDKIKKIYAESYSSEWEGWIAEFATVEQKAFMEEIEELILGNPFENVERGN